MKNPKNLRTGFLPILLAAAALAFFPSLGRAQLNVTASSDATLLVERLSSTTSGINISNAQFTGPFGSSGEFTGGEFGLTDGIALTTGLLSNAPGPNTSGNTGHGNFSNGYLPLEIQSGFMTADAAVLEFDFVPEGEYVTLSYVFASDEYNEYVCTVFHDEFGIFVTGPGYATENVAFIPGTDILAGINTVNKGEVGMLGSEDLCDPMGLDHSQFFVDNSTVMNAHLEYDGYTLPLTVEIEVVPGETYHMAIAIADVNDFFIDSAILLGTNSMVSYGCDAGVLTFDDYPELTTLETTLAELPNTIGVTSDGEGLNSYITYALTEIGGQILATSETGVFDVFYLTPGEYNFYTISHAGPIQVSDQITAITGGYCVDISDPLTFVINDDSEYDCPDLSANVGDDCDDGNEETINDTVTEDCECMGQTPVVENTPLLCSDGIDNDGDGVADCDDPKCQALAQNIGCQTCFEDGLSFADVVLEYEQYCSNNLSADPTGALGMPDYLNSDYSTYVSLGGGYVKLGFTNNTLVNSGTPDPDLYVFEIGPLVESSFIELRPLNAETEDLCIAAGLLDTDGDGYYEFGGIGGALAAVDIDAFFDDLPPASVFFDAIKIIDGQSGCAHATPGADIDAVCALSNVGCAVGSPCDDGDPLTENDVLNADCECVGTPITYDCPDLMADYGDPCDDGDENTENDTIDNDCNCAGTPVYDCPDLMADYGDPCDDGDENTENDAIDNDCNCVGTPVYDCPDLMADYGDPCDDDDENTENDTVDNDCNCVGTPMYDCPDLMADVGDPCDDGDENTENDAIDNDCNCVGTPVYDCPDLMADYGDPCDDGDENTENDTVDNDCNCAGTPVYDCPDLMADYGDPCDDGDENTENDAINNDCNCVGTPVYDCPDLMSDYGDPCDDGDENTENDTIDNDCNCVGTPMYDCPDLMADYGDPCDDGDENTENDTIDNDCNCAGTPVYDCPDLMADYGDPCDDGDENTENDTIDNDCNCVGTPVYDCPDLMANNGDECFTVTGLPGVLVDCECTPELTCPADAGGIAFADGSDYMEFCATDGVPSTFSFANDPSPYPNIPFVWVGTHADGTVINYTNQLSQAESFNFDEWGVGVFHIYGLSYSVWASNALNLKEIFLLGGEVNISELEGCFDLSEPIVLEGVACPLADFCYPVEVVAFEQGLQTDGNPVAADRSDPTAALGEPDRSNAPGGFVSLGVGGSITLAFETAVPDHPGNDLRIYETSYAGDDCSGPSDEHADVELSIDGINFHYAGTICRDGEIDIADAGLDAAIFVRITNAENTASLDGFDLDGIESLHECAELNVPFCSAEVAEYTPGTQLNGSLLPADRTDPNQALGEPENVDAPVFVTLGYGGSIVLYYEHGIANHPGNDIEVVETTYNFSSCGAYPEYADVYFSVDGENWHFAKTVCKGDPQVDISDAAPLDVVYYVKVVNNDDLSISPDGFDLDGIICLNEQTERWQPLEAELAAGELSSHPNPTTGASVVVFSTPTSVRTTVEVYDMNGRHVATVFDATTEGGEEYRIDFDASALPNGIYIYRMTTEVESLIDKFMIAK